MLMSEFISNCMKDIKEFEDALNQSLTAERTNIELQVRIESRLTVFNFVNLLNTLLDKKSNSYVANKEATIETMQPLIIRLKNRWEHIKQTDAIYCHTPDSFGNRVCAILAWRIAEVLNKGKNETDQIDPYKLLMPTLSEAEIKHIKDKKFHEFVLDDNGSPILVLDCLLAASKVKEAQKYFTTFEAEKGKRPLSIKESERVKHHTTQSKSFTVDILMGSTLTNTHESQTITDLKDVLQDARPRGLEVFKKPKFINMAPTYGLIQSSGILQGILLNSKTYFDHLADILAYHVDSQEWDKFLTSSSADDLTRIISTSKNNSNQLVIDNRSFADKLKNEVLARSVNAADNNLTLKAKVFCYVHIYWLDRRELADYKTYSASFFGISKQDKQLAVNFLKTLLTTPNFNLSDLSAQIKLQPLNVIAALEDTSMYYGPSNLCMVVQQAIKIGELQNKKTRTHNYMN